MERQKETPKKFYPKFGLESQSKCRLCGSVFDKRYGKNLFLKKNENLRRVAEIVNAGTLPSEEGLPNLLCRPCERRLDNFNKFRKMVCEVQNSLIRKKRCIDVSPSAPITSAKSSRAPSGEGASFSGRRRLSFNPDELTVQSDTDPPVQVCIYSQNNFVVGTSGIDAIFIDLHFRTKYKC